MDKRLLLVLVLFVVPIVEASFSLRGEMYEGETKVFDADGVEIRIISKIITDSNPKGVLFEINGESSGLILQGDSGRLDDGTEILVHRIIPNEAGDPVPDLVSFYIFSSGECGDDVCNVDENCLTCYDCGECEVVDTTTTTIVPVTTTTAITTTTIADTTTTFAEVEEEIGFFSRIIRWFKGLF